jgi:two-component system sensor histidine kinase MprB
VSWWPRSWSKMGRMSFRARLGTFTAVAVGLTVTLAAVASYFVVSHELYRQIDASLRSTLEPGSRINAQVEGRILSQSGTGFIQVISPTGVLYNSLQYEPGQARVLQPTAAQYAIAADPAGASRIDTVDYNGGSYRVITETAQLFDGSTVAIQIGRPLTETHHALSTLGLILWIVALGGIGLAVGFGWLIGRETLRPVARLTEAAEYVAATQDLSSSIEVTSEDELGRLARSFNSMLDALAASRNQQAQLISDAGHELRTPLTSLRTNIEVLLRRPDLPETDRAELLADVEGQLQELTNLIGDLVELARHEERQEEPMEVRFDAIVAGAVERVRRRAPGVSFETHITPGSVRAHPALLERAVVNVLDNAAKWSPPEGTVDVWLQRGAIWTLDVHDHGPGIAPEDLPRVFDRFYRAASARSLPGSGLGLAIVAQVVAEHGGTVSAAVPPEGGTVIHIELPTVAEVESGTEVAPPTALSPPEEFGPGGSDPSAPADSPAGSALPR